MVTASNYELLLFGGSQQGIADSGRGQAGNAVTDMLWRCHLVGGEWRSVAADGPLPGARSGHSAVMYDGKVSHLHFLDKL